MIKEKAIIKSTGEEVEIKSSYEIMKISCSFSYDFDISEEFDISDKKFVFNGDNDDEGKYQILSNGLKVNDNEVISSKVDIRDYKIDKLNG